MARLVRKKAEATPSVDEWADARRIAEAAAEHKAIDIKAYDVRELTVIADCFVVCSAGSEPHMKAVLSAVRDVMRDVGHRPLGAEGEPTGGWAVLDYGNTIFHLFREEAREFYDLDGLWGDAPQVELHIN